MQSKYNATRMGELVELYQSALDEITWVQTLPVVENARITKAILSVEYPYLMHNILFYINKDLADLLAASSRPLLKEWGIKCQNFYNQGGLKVHVDPPTGVVIAKVGGIDHRYGFFRFKGQGVWDIVKKGWVPSSNSTGNPGFQAVHYPNFSKNPQFPIDLITPVHVAALIGNIELMEYLRKLGASVNDNHNTEGLTPLELAIISEQVKVIDYLVEQGVSTHTALKLAVEKSSFKMIKKIVNMKPKPPIMNDILQAALDHNKEWHDYLNIRREEDTVKQLKRHQGNAFNALKAILDYEVIPVNSLVDLIKQNPEIISTIENEADGNTLIHQLVIKKESVKLNAILQAIAEARHNNSKLVFDRERTNRAGKTILDLALERINEDKELAKCILLLANPKINDAQQNIIRNKLEIPEIRRGKEDIIDNNFSVLNQELNVQRNALKKTNQVQRKILVEQEEVNAKQNQKLQNLQRKVDTLTEKVSTLTEEVCGLKQASKIQKEVLEVTVQELIATKQLAENQQEQIIQLTNQDQFQQILLMKMMQNFQPFNNESIPPDYRRSVLPQENTLNPNRLFTRQLENQFLPLQIIADESLDGYNPS